jgi:spore maturation protein CgeB
MKILVVGTFKYEMYEKALFNAFKYLGEDVCSFEFSQYDYHGEDSLLKFFNKFQDRFLFGPKVSKINRLLLKQVKEEKPDLIFLYRTTPVYAKTVSKIKRLGPAIFSYNNDDPFSSVPPNYYWRHYLKAAYFCDYNFVYRNKNINDFKLLGIEKVGLLKSYYITQNNFPIECPKTFDVIFIGHFENDGRDKYIKALIEAGINITVFGDELWEKAPLYNEIKQIVKKPVRKLEYNLTINRAKIALVFLSKINSDTYTRRCFEIPATKTLMLSEYTDELNSMFEEDKEALYFRNPEELVHKCRYLLKDNVKMKEIANNGYLKLHESGHNIINRAEKILKVYYGKN